MSVEEARACEPARHGLHMAIDHIAGAVGLGIIKGERKDIGFGTQLVDRFQSCAADVLAGPLV